MVLYLPQQHYSFVNIVKPTAGDVRNNPTPSRGMSLSEATCGWGLPDQADEKLRAWSTHEDQGCHLDAPIDEGLQRLTAHKFMPTEIATWSQASRLLNGSGDRPCCRLCAYQVSLRPIWAILAAGGRLAGSQTWPWDPGRCREH